MSENLSNEPGTITTQQASRLLMLTPQRIGQLVAEGVIPAPIRRDAYALVPTVQGYLRFLVERPARRDERESALQDVKRRQIEARLA